MQRIGGRGLGCQCTVKFRNFFLGDLPLLEAGSLLRGSMVLLPQSAVQRFPVSLCPLTNEPMSLMNLFSHHQSLPWGSQC